MAYRKRRHDPADTGSASDREGDSDGETRPVNVTAEQALCGAAVCCLSHQTSRPTFAESVALYAFRQRSRRRGFCHGCPRTELCHSLLPGPIGEESRASAAQEVRR